MSIIGKSAKFTKRLKKEAKRVQAAIKVSLSPLDITTVATNQTTKSSSKKELLLKTK
ncbi:23886_t:CDS:2 [Dentiscutata erythropus]|uniref:23886_t:CDS:1 n=1 Tax=Dentiscutata erythropus TaxID=1348616 RepID=A0A9N9ICF8_9GLOM|nr:23886_t:CDS:2 [Dentiscutata erythropus]